MGKILLITEEPNNQASTLNHDDLFDISKNTFGQFFGRLLFGDEERYRIFFNSTFFTWMHAKGSECHGDKKNDGKRAIRRQVSINNYSLIITIGAPAMKVFIKNKFACFKVVLTAMKKGPIAISSISNWLNENISNIDKEILFVSIPHPSGQNQGFWMSYAKDLSNCLIEIQSIVNRIAQQMHDELL